MNAGAGGFAGAPVTKFILASSISSSVILQAAHGFQRRPSPYLHFLSQSFIFRHPGELACGTLLLYYFRLLERQRGSAKHGACVASTLAISYGLQSALAAAFSVVLPSGPYGLIFANFVPFALDIPPAQRFTLLGLPMTDKAFVYLAGLQLLANSSLHSALAGGCGLVAGLAYHYNFLGIKRLKVPRRVQRWCSWAFGGLLGSTQPRRQVLPPPQAPSAAGGAGPLHPRQASAPALPEASPDAVQQLVAMGFDAARAAAALQQSHNDIQTALTFLL
ncbi:hypothetical protein ABBQ38_009450 [Trebouxia sp. C0009 RCD-2024]